MQCVFQHMESSGGQCAGCRFRDEESLAHFSPWSCGTAGSSLSPFEPEALTHTAAHSCSERPVKLLTRLKVAPTLLCSLKIDSFALINGPNAVLMQDLDGPEGEAGGRKQWLHTSDPYRRLKDEDPIIPFSEAPIISKWGAISRVARTGYHTTDPIQATACQGSASTTPINFKGWT